MYSNYETTVFSAVAGDFALYCITIANKRGCQNKYIVKTLEACLVLSRKIEVYFQIIGL